MKRKRSVLVSAGILVAGYLLCRYVFFDVHGMKQWPTLLWTAGCFVWGISVLLRGRFLPLFTSVGYSAGFALGVLFQSDGVDPGGARTNNLWIIWTIAFFCILVLGVLCELAAQPENRQPKK